jgi:sulfonate transport system substrate-binding protein
MKTFLSRRAALAALAAALVAAAGPALAAEPAKSVTLDYAYYNPVALALKEKGWLEKDLSKDGISVRWVLSLGSNKAIEFLNARSIPSRNGRRWSRGKTRRSRRSRTSRASASP